MAQQFDRTPAIVASLRKADVLVQDHVVIEIVNALYGRVSDTWAVDYPEEAACFFSMPYPDVAIHLLGYPGEEGTYVMAPPPPVAPPAVSDSDPVPFDYDPRENSNQESVQGSKTLNNSHSVSPGKG